MILFCQLEPINQSFTNLILSKTNAAIDSFMHPRKDRYNKKIRKYYVIYGEEDDDVSENEETHQHEESGEVSRHNIGSCYPCPHLSFPSMASLCITPQATEQLAFNRLGEDHGDSESEEDDEKEKQAEQINVAEKDGWEG